MQHNFRANVNQCKPGGGGKKKKKKKGAKPPSIQSSQKPHFQPKIPTSPVAHTGYFAVDRYSHHFVIKNVSTMGQQLINKFAMRFIQWETVGYGPYARKKPKCTFAARVRPLNEYRFHRGQWDEFVQYLMNCGIEMEKIPITVYGLHKPAPLNASLTTSKTPYDYQVPIIGYMVSDKPSKYKMVEVQAGRGKASSLHAHIKVPGGWSTMGEMKIGTEVITPRGTVTKVDGVYPQGNLDIYRITFSDGRQAESCLEHLWKVRLEDGQSQNYWEVLNLKTIMESSSFKAGQAYIPLIESEDSGDLDLPVDPWLLGALLGAGQLDPNGTTITKEDDFVKEKVASLLKESLQIGEGDDLLVRLDASTALHLNAGLIPNQYLYGSHQQRLDLLRGLMDSNGRVSVDGTISYTARNFKLVSDIQYLVRSLGGLARDSFRLAPSTHLRDKGKVRAEYRVNICYKKPSEFFTSPQERERVNDDHHSCKDLKLRIDKIELIGSMPAQCISVEDDEHMYVTNDFVATHNTFMASCAADALNYRILMFLKLQFIEKWESDVESLLGITRDNCLVIQGSNSLIKAIAMISSGEIAPKAILVSNRTYQNWIKSYEEQGPALDEAYGCSPNTFIETMRSGMRIIDEVHMDFHLNCKIDLYTHVERSISLSATLISGDPFISRMMEMAYPSAERYKNLPFKRYVDTYPVTYRWRRPELLKYTEQNREDYSHHAYERSIQVNRSMLQAYLSFIEKLVNEHYDKRASKDDKCLVYCASIAMCTVVAGFLKVSFPDRIVNRYCEIDPYENLLESEISCSTLQSAGTGHDLENLITVIMTTCVNSPASNIQGFGRLRELSGKDTRFVFLTNIESPKQMKYYDEKMKLLETRAKTIKPINYTTPIDEGIDL